MAQDELERIRGYVTDEREAALLYRRLAETVQGRERKVLLRLAHGEESHAAHWERVLTGLGADGPSGTPRLGFSGRLALLLGRRFGLIGAMPVLERHEGREITEYSDEPHAPRQMVDDERDHTELVRSLAPTWRQEIAGTLRAGVFGISDGIVSNLALVIGVFGAGATTSAVVTAGVAGLVAGALSMAVGEYVSVASQREVLQAGESGDADADPWKAAIASFITFSFGAFIPLAPFLATSGTAAALIALFATGLLLYVVGATLSLLTMRSAVRAGLRQLGLGWGAAGATYVVGLLIGGGTPA
ncbi:MAG: VIT1/CCC1 transporter family protein [Euzebya sp.]